MQFDYSTGVILCYGESYGQGLQKSSHLYLNYMMNDDDQLQNHHLKVMRMARSKCQNQRQLQPGRLGVERGSPVYASAKVWTCHGLEM